MLARYGRWLQLDPLGFGAGDVNLYRYVGNEPTNLIDPTGTTGVLWEFFGWVWTIIPQDAIYLLPSGGQGSYPAGANALLAQLQAIQQNGGTILVLIIKGHGGSQGMYVGPLNGNNLFLTIQNGNIMLGGHNITQLLRGITNRRTRISFRGCANSMFAHQVAQILGNGALVEGELIPSVGIPGTTITIGPNQNFTNRGIVGLLPDGATANGVVIRPRP